MDVVVVVIVVIVVLVIVVCLIKFQINDNMSFRLDRSHDQHHISQTVGFLAVVTIHGDYA